MKASLIVTATCAFALLFPNFGRAFLEIMEVRVARMANCRRIVPMIALAVLLFSAMLTFFFRLPEPRIHDEFSYLLQSDTFAHGRLANPTHPLWKYFETFHELQQPVYASKYPPGQALFLALGQVIWKPILGVWVSTALATAALFWALRAVFSPALSFCGALLALLNADVLGWNWNFWGGSVSLLGGSLVIGAMFRNIQVVTAKTNAIMGIGCGLLAITRPFEGLIVCSLAVLSTLIFLIKDRRQRFLTRMFGPLLCGLLPFIAFVTVYNYRVTGNALTPPYVLYEKQYSDIPLFIWQAMPPKSQTPHRREIETYYQQERKNARFQQRPKGYFVNLWSKLKAYDRYFWHGLIVLLWIPALWHWRERAVRLSFIIFVFTILATCGSTFWAFPHYCALIFPLAIALTMFGLRSLYLQRRTRLLATLVFGCLCGLGLVMFSMQRWTSQNTQWQYKRAQLVAELSRTAPKNLVLVRYSPQHNRHKEWIYNAADIDAAPVVFAPDGDAAQNAPLLNYFKGYQVLHIEPDRPIWGE